MRAKDHATFIPMHGYEGVFRRIYTQNYNSAHASQEIDCRCTFWRGRLSMEKILLLICAVLAFTHAQNDTIPGQLIVVTCYLYS